MYLALKRSTTQGSFFKNNSLTSFHPLLLKALLFSEIASPSSVPPPLPPYQPPPPPPLPSLSCFSFHMLVLFFLIFPLCKKWKAENRMSEGEKRQEAKAATVHRWNHCLQCWDCSLLCTDSYGLQYSPKPHPYTSHSANQTFSIDNAKCSMCPVLNYCIPMWYSHSMTRGTALISHRQLHKKHPLNRIQTYKLFEKLNPAHACFLN